MKIRAREITSNWPDRAMRCRDNPDEVLTVFDGDILRDAIVGGEDPERALHRAATARIYLRYTRAGMCYAVCIWSPPNNPNHVFYGTAGGYGYDKAAAALAGMPVGYVGDELICLTDHCGLDREDREWLVRGRRARSFLAHRGGNLPEPLFVY